jgi:hypothetical protein
MTQFEQRLRLGRGAAGSELRAQLESLLQSQSDAAAQKLKSGAPPDDELHRIEQIQAVLKLLPQANTTTLSIAGAVAVTCLVAACVLWTIRLPTRLQMTVSSESVTVRLPSGLNWSGNWDLGGTPVRMQDMSRIDLPPELSSATLLSGTPWLEVSNGDFSLKRLELQPNAEISIKKGEQTLSINSWNAPMLGQLELFGKPVVDAGRSLEQTEKLSAANFEIPGIVTFYHDTGRMPSVLRIAPHTALELADLPIQGISFAREAVDSDTSFRSGIIKGKLTIPSTGEELQLDSGTRLRLNLAEGILSKLTIGSDGVTLAFQGKVTSAFTGPPGFERELEPTLLEWLYHQQRLGFFWTVVTFLWGVLWSARTLFFK